MAKVLSIEIGILTTKLVEMDYGAKKPKVYKCVEVATPEGCISDGYLVDENLPRLKDALARAIADNSIKTKKVVFTVFSSKIISREVMIPAVKPHQINAVIESNVTEYFPVELDDYKISHIHLSTFKEGANIGKHMVLVVAMEKALIATYEKLAMSMGLTIMDIDYAGNSAYQATKHKIGSDAVLVAKVEADHAILAIVRQGNLVLQRSMNTGYADKDKMTDDVSSDSLETVVNTVIRLIEFYTGNNDRNVIDHIFVIGSGAGKKEISELIATETALKCVVLDSISGVNLQKDIDATTLYKYMACIGAGMASIGFGSQKEKKSAGKRKEVNYFNASILMIVFFVVVVVLIIVFAVLPYKEQVRVQQDLNTKEQLYSPAKDVYVQYTNILNLYEQVRYGNNLTMNSNDGILAFLDELERKMPADIEVLEFSPNDEQCQLSVKVYDKETAAGIIQTLRNDFTSLESVRVESITEQVNTDVKVVDANNPELEIMSTWVSFTVTCKYVTTAYEDPQAVVVATE